MPRYGKAAGKSVKSAMTRRKHGTLKSGKGGKGGRVKSRSQAKHEKKARRYPEKNRAESQVSRCNSGEPVSASVYLAQGRESEYSFRP